LLISSVTAATIGHVPSLLLLVPIGPCVFRPRYAVFLVP